MATNYVQAGDVLDLAIEDVKSGNPVAQGDIVGVALTDTNESGIVEVATKGVFKLSVKASDGTNNSAIAVGDYLYLDGTTINKNSSKTKFGLALEPVEAGQTATIKVKLAAK